MGVIGPYFYVFQPEKLNDQNWQDLDQLFRWNLDKNNSQDTWGRTMHFTPEELCYRRLLSLVEDSDCRPLSCLIGVQAGALLSLTQWI